MPESVQDRPTKAHEQVFMLAKSPSYFYDAEAIKEPLQESSIERVKHGWKTNRMNVSGSLARGETVQTNMDAMGSRFAPESGRNRRSVWTLGPESFPGAHFAVMPSKLVEPCILAGTSAYGCCEQCKAPWERVVEREKVGQLRPMAESGGVHSQSNYRTYAENGRITDTTSTLNHVYSNTTLGWQPTCTCNAAVIPCTVLDCFSGSGTVGAVALKYHRNYIGIDLSSTYNELAHERIGRTQPLLLAAD